MRRIFCTIVTIAVLSIVAAAQAPAPTAKLPGSSEGGQNEVYGGFLFEPTDWGSTWSKFYGLDANYTRSFGKRFAAVADFDWTRENGSNPGDLDRGTAHNASQYAYRFGPRVNVVNKGRLQLYAVGLFGGAHFTSIVPYPGRSSPLVQKDWFGFTWAVGGGAEYHFTNHWGIRGQWDHTRVPWGTELTDASDWDRITGGVTWRW